MILHFARLKLMPHFSAQSHRQFRSLWSLSRVIHGLNRFASFCVVRKFYQFDLQIQFVQLYFKIIYVYPE
jgi:hypothetical protein